MKYSDYNDYELLNYISDGNEEANNIIIKKYEPLIAKISQKMLPYCINGGIEKSDLMQEGMIGLNHAIDRYSEQKDVLFFTCNLQGHCYKLTRISHILPYQVLRTLHLQALPEALTQDI